VFSQFIVYKLLCHCMYYMQTSCILYILYDSLKFEQKKREKERKKKVNNIYQHKITLYVNLIYRYKLRIF